MSKHETVKGILDPHKVADKDWYLSLLEEDGQTAYEEEHLAATLAMLKKAYVSPYKQSIAAAEAEIAALNGGEKHSAGNFRDVLELDARVKRLKAKLDTLKCFFTEPYFARMDLTDPKEGYNSYYIGKRGDVKLEIVDWRAPLAVRYYQKSRVNFTINEYEYKTVLRRALSVKNGKLLSFKNEYLSVRDVLTPEEIAGRDEEILFDPYLRNIIRDRKDDTHVRDIIRTIQEQQFAVITLPERESFVLQGCAGSGKTMILLHRLSYLMYNNEALSPKDVLVITPSDSFNSFIDELSKVLELKKVYTVTLTDYFLRVLKNEGVSLADKMTSAREDQKYLEYLYSSRFFDDVHKEIARLYDDVSGFFISSECREVAERVLEGCAARQAEYLRIKNASVRIRRCVLGEMKENGEGGFYFTKPMRALMSAFVQVEDFLRYVLSDELRTPDRFFRRFVEFYRCMKETVRAAAIFAAAASDLSALAATADKEIADLKRYRIRTGAGETYTYPERIERRLELKREAAQMCDVLGKMGEGLELLEEFFRILRLSDVCTEAGKCETPVDLVRFYYRRTVREYKKKFGMKGIYPSDAYALCAVLSAAGRQLTPRYGLVFVDEGQDISPSEYALLKEINPQAAFNVFGDLRQNITPWRSVGDWSAFEEVYELNRNYRNTNEIVAYVTQICDVAMDPIGLKGADVSFLSARKLGAFFREKQGLKAVIAREEYLPLFAKRGFSLLSRTGKLSESKINVMSVYESKGLEFTTVAVYPEGMTQNEKYIACTRALKELAIVGPID